MTDYMKKTFKVIDNVKHIGGPGHPVFLVMVDGDKDSPVVLKAELSGRSADIEHTGKVMKAASPEGVAKVLAAEEVAALAAYLDHVQFLLDARLAEEDPDDAELRKTFFPPPSPYREAKTWTKMAKAEGVTDLRAAVDKLKSGDKSGVRAIAEALNAKGGLEKLGMIIAVDLYNNNLDRFDPHGNRIANPRTGFDEKGNVIKDGKGKVKYPLKALSNPGNVLLAVVGKTLTPIGLDAFDQAQSKFTTALGGDDDSKVWRGFYLTKAHAKERAEFAANVCDDLELCMGPRNRALKFMEKKRLNADAAKRLLKGIEDGTREIIKRLDALAAKAPNSLPVGVESRLKALKA